MLMIHREIVSLEGATPWMLLALRGHMIKAIKEYMQAQAAPLLEAKEDVKEWRAWALEKYPDFEWQALAIEVSSGAVESATAKLLEMRPNVNEGIAWHRKQVQSYLVSYESSISKFWVLGGENKPEAEATKCHTGSLKDLRTSLQKGAGS